MNRSGVVKFVRESLGSEDDADIESPVNDRGLKASGGWRLMSREKGGIFMNESSTTHHWVTGLITDPSAFLG